MSRSLVRRLVPSPAMLVALLALMIAMGGTSYAAVTLAKNSVRSPHIVNGQVKTADLGASSVTTAKVKDGSLIAGDFAPGELPAGVEGPAGPPGPAGPQGVPGPVDTVSVIRSTSPVAAGSFDAAIVQCPAGMEAIGGGVDPGNVLTMTVTQSTPVFGTNPSSSRPIGMTDGQHGSATGWMGSVRNDGTTTYSAKVTVICAG
ncbi:hypothetical protein [Nocardioides sp. T2.26MG-1]|uniref:hypothetical protein n=1 Tax=Nocardioides sp. T2.26MG-1 TaxID=3041166 RepID=UPI002477B56F|nr:hypothetical protein [Nocardioides sp. T2.26MG-1]CAI9414552.1 hypothetical protein HIDPHFAB_02301 [Nocardioides sp. T2.26MG-1]